MLVFAVFILLASAVRPFPGVGRAIRGRHVRDANTPEPAVSFYTQQIDHTNFELALKYNTYQQRILQYSGYWGKNQEWKKGDNFFVKMSIEMVSNVAFRNLQGPHFLLHGK